MWLSRHRGRTVPALAALCLAVAGCGDDDDGGPTGPSGGTAVTADNVGQMQTALMTTFAGVAAKGPGTHSGASSGQVTVAIATGKPAQQPAARFSMDFDNYSDDGAQFIDGDLTYEVGQSIVVNGDLELSGTYAGDLGFDLTVTTDGQTSGSVTVNGNRIDLGALPGGGGGGGGDVNQVIYGGTPVAMATVTCNPNGFGIPRLGFSAKNADTSISANVEVRGTAPEDGSVFSLDPDLGRQTSRVKLYYDSKNWTSVLDAGKTVSYASDGSKQSIQGADIQVANDRDASETMVVSFHIVCQ